MVALFSIIALSPSSLSHAHPRLLSLSPTLFFILSRVTLPLTWQVSRSCPEGSAPFQLTGPKKGEKPSPLPLCYSSVFASGNELTKLILCATVSVLLCQHMASFVTRLNQVQALFTKSQRAARCGHTVHIQTSTHAVQTRRCLINLSLQQAATPPPPRTPRPHYEFVTRPEQAPLDLLPLGSSAEVVLIYGESRKKKRQRGGERRRGAS